jgi:multicomponent Na+:H+ antiporter subunit E
MNRVFSILLLTIFYLGITVNLEILNILAGLLIATGVAFLLPSEKTLLRWRELPQILLATVQYIVILAYDLMKSGFQVAGMVLSPKMKIQQGIGAIHTEVESEIGVALSAHAITLTPGELVVEIDETGHFYMHCLDATKSAEYAQEAQKMRRDLLDKIFP